jgi:hypothetical protein
MGDYSILQLPDGTQLAYEVLGSDHRALVPLVFVSGTTSCRGDTEKVSSLLAKHRQGAWLTHWTGDVYKLTRYSVGL